ncbi:hypothetical protein [Solimonas soli]|uniref:hypothetical protein n=1 Tax=Solimonas soli TaxID=413479 RepID=UPI0012F7FC18|nr:hypothetical protein [Solimonas soli]
MNGDRSRADDKPRKRRGRPKKADGRGGIKPEDTSLAELWKQAAKAGGSRDEVSSERWRSRWTLTLSQMMTRTLLPNSGLRSARRHRAKFHRRHEKGLRYTGL